MPAVPRRSRPGVPTWAWVAGGGLVVAITLVVGIVGLGSDDTGSMGGQTAGDRAGAFTDGNGSTTPTTTPEPSVYEGTGDTMLDITKPEADGPAVATFLHQGTSNFIVTALDGNQRRIGGVVNAIGGYTGSRPLDFLARHQTAVLEVKADGPWRIELRSVYDARRFADSIEGSGDDVLLYSGRVGPAEVRHDGTTRFTLTSFGPNGVEFLANEDGPFDDRVPLDAPVLIEVHADGNWSLEAAGG